MMKRIFHLYVLATTITVISCDSSNSRLKEVYAIAKENKSELQHVLIHYKDNELKLAAAEFLLENMFHSSIQSKTFEKYRSTILESDSVLDYNKLWLDMNSIGLKDESSIVEDAKVITADYLIRNIDQAFYIWENAPWYNQISFENFCSYILPYRVLNEPISDWRETLHTKYKHLIENIKYPREAYDVVYRYVSKEFKDQAHKCPYVPNVILLNRMMEGICSYECVYTISVLRSLGIPAAYDMIPYWANYSQSGHSWVTYGIDSLVGGKSIDSSTALKAKNGTSKFKFRVDSIKKKSKVYRKKYQAKRYKDVYRNRSLLFFNDPFIEDVSAFYGYNNEVRIDRKDKQQVFLCTFAATKNWQPVVKGFNEGSAVLFSNIGDDIAYLPVYFAEEQMLPVENPFILYSGGIKKVLSPDTTKKERVVLRRKFLLFAHWIGRWSYILGSGIDVSNDPDFRRYERLYYFAEIPDGIVRVNIASSKPYRYVRFRAPSNGRPDIAEMRFYGVRNCKDTVLLKGDIIHKDITKENALKAFDSDYSTYTQTKNDHYWFGLDLGTKDKFILNSVEFCMRHDMNMIEIGDHYELFYYDYGWRSLGSQVSTCDSLVYSNVPSNSLLWLRNHTKGKEERIFTYEDGRQVWW